MLVEQEHRWRPERGEDERQALALPGRQRTDGIVEALLEPEAERGQPIAHQLSPAPRDGDPEPAPLAAAHRDRHVVLDAEVGRGSRARVVEHPGHRRRAAVVGPAGHVPAGQTNPSGGRPDRPGDDRGGRAEQREVGPEVRQHARNRGVAGDHVRRSAVADCGRTDGVDAGRDGGIGTNHDGVHPPQQAPRRSQRHRFR